MFGGTLRATNGNLFQTAKPATINLVTDPTLLPNIAAATWKFVAANPGAAPIVGILGMAIMAAGFVCGSECVVIASDAVNRLRLRKNAVQTLGAH
ncbi:MAG: hypothetical protein WC521_01725 [Bdellovibrionales bacterium]|jgi:hypothetical protein